MSITRIKHPQFIPAQGEYIVRPRGRSVWQEFNTARLLVSIGRPYYEGEKMKSLVEWLANRFEQVVVIVHDTIQRHNHEADGFPIELAEQKARRAGTDWLQNERAVIEVLPNVDVVRWDSLKSIPSFQDNLNQIRICYETCPAFHAAIESAIDAVVSRRLKSGANMNELEWRSKSREYLLEEAAGYVGMYERNDAVDIYPGTRPDALHMVMNKQLPFLEKKPWRQGFTRLGFERRG